MGRWVDGEASKQFFYFDSWACFSSSPFRDPSTPEIDPFEGYEEEEEEMRSRVHFSIKTSTDLPSVLLPHSDWFSLPIHGLFTSKLWNVLLSSIMHKKMRTKKKKMLWERIWRTETKKKNVTSDWFVERNHLWYPIKLELLFILRLSFSTYFSSFIFEFCWRKNS